MSDDTRRILDLLAQGKITVDEADRLIAAVGEQAAAPKAEECEPGKLRYLRITVHKPANERCGDKDVNIRVPIAMVRGGMRLGAMIPGLVGDQLRAKLREQKLDMDFSKLDPAALESVLKDLGEMNIDIDSGKAQVRITCE
jgi:hypothetical protein